MGTELRQNTRSAEQDVNFTQVAGAAGIIGKASPELPGDPTLEMQRATEQRSTSNPATIGIND